MQMQRVGVGVVEEGRVDVLVVEDRADVLDRDAAAAPTLSVGAAEDVD
jgi:hypothetical protein